MAFWKPIHTAPAGQVVMTRIYRDGVSRNTQPLKKQGNLWFLPDGSMYVYYTPTEWKPLSAPTTEAAND